MSNALAQRRARIGATPSTRISRESSWAARTGEQVADDRHGDDRHGSAAQPCRVRVTVKLHRRRNGTEH